ncbi:T-complex protein 1 subunit theta, partial [Diplonema papillatum]
IKSATDAKVAVFNCAIDVAATETKGNVLLESAKELIGFSASEEERLENALKAVVATGVKVVVSNSNFSDIALHFLEKFGIMVIKIASKFEMKRLCLAVGAKQMVKLDPPTAEDIGHIDNVAVREYGETKVIQFLQEKDDSRLSTIILRGATEQRLDDLERAVDDGVNTYKMLGRDGSFVAGAGAVDMEINKDLLKYADETAGIDQYSIRCFANAFEVGPRALADVAGHHGHELMPEIVAAHEAGDKKAGVDVETGTATTTDVVDAYLTRFWSLSLATDAALNVLKVDQIIMSKPAGGPRPPKQGARDDED